MKPERDRRPNARVAALCGLLVLALVPAAVAQGPEASSERTCSVHGSWMAEVDIGARFFVSYSRGSDANGGPMAVEWIAGDPTLFGNFPTAVSLTQGVGVWQRIDGHTYQYTWISYGLDAAGVPVYAWKGSGTGTLPSCDMIVFDYVAEIFPMPLHPLVDDPVDCISGGGTKIRVSLDLATCS